MFKDIFIDSPWYSPGVILGNSTNPLQDITFDNVTVTNADKSPWDKKYYDCKNVVNSVAIGGTSPVPPCFKTGNIEFLGNR